ncbi:MAG: endosialidase [Roseburia sp.]|nr:endosialidase [Roseburia sp.]MCM1278226.1 endosialidase [Robinsoniella sp.]
MAVVAELLRAEDDKTISFGNHQLDKKEKLEDFSFEGDLYKVKTYKTMTKLEKNGMFLYESVPGTSVFHLEETDKGISFLVEGKEDAQITVGLKDETEYEVFVSGESSGKMSTSLGGKLNLSVELADMGQVSVKVVEA